MFLGRLFVSDDPEPGMWCMSAPLAWSDPLFGTIIVPVGFRTDLASIPRLFRNLPMLDPNGQSRRPAVVHDWLYAAVRRHGLYDKRCADEFLRHSLQVEGMDGFTAGAFYYAVHWFGGPSWDGDKGLLETTDFDTVEHFSQWRNSIGGPRGAAR